MNVRAYQLYLGQYAREGRAVAIWESEGEDIYALSPAALGAGLMQQSWDWQNTYPPQQATVGSYLYQWAMAGGRLHPYYQLSCYATFCAKHSDMTMDERWRCFHYGHPTLSDPDNYVRDVMAVYNRLESDGSDKAKT